jgi:hypothetical protein
MNIVRLEHCVISLPMPLLPVVEDVGWWQGRDGSAANGPYRNNFPRRHSLADYQALSRFADRLSTRIVLGMVMGEWDRTNFLKDLPGATWMGAEWNNRLNQGPWLDEAADYLNSHSSHLEIALHGICHEFWHNGKMQRSEFHDTDNRMRPAALVRRHLDAYASLLEQNGLTKFPRLFVPPALYHSFGNGEDSIQALLHDYGIRYVTTRFSRARRYSEPVHPNMTWECGVTILERGLSPVDWDVPASPPVWNEPGPILPLHWGNLLHPDPGRNAEIVDAWASLLLEKTAGVERILAEGTASCWRQAGVFFLAEMHRQEETVVIDLGALPDMAAFFGPFFLKIQEEKPMNLICTGAEIIRDEVSLEHIRILKLLPEKGQREIVLSFKGEITKKSSVTP